MSQPRVILLLLVFFGSLQVWGLDGEVNVTVERTLVQVVQGPPGTPAQELGVDRAQTEALASHRQPLGAGFTAEASLLASLDSLPSNDTRNLPSQKLAPSARVLEAWLGWEPLPGVLTVGAGKRVIQPSSGFSHKPLDWLSRSDDREGRIGAQGSWFGDSYSATVFAAPAGPISSDPAFVWGKGGVTIGSLDAQAVVMRETGPVRGGLGLDTGWGDHLTFRAEGAVDASPSQPRTDVMGGLTWTGDDKTTVMFEAARDARGTTPIASGFARLAGDLDDKLSGELWTKAEWLEGAPIDHWGGWTGAKLTWLAPKWSLSGAWTGAWGPAGTTAGDTSLRWKTSVEAKVFW